MSRKFKQTFSEGIKQENACIIKINSAYTEENNLICKETFQYSMNQT